MCVGHLGVCEERFVFIQMLQDQLAFAGLACRHRNNKSIFVCDEVFNEARPIILAGCFE